MALPGVSDRAEEVVVEVGGEDVCEIDGKDVAGTAEGAIGVGVGVAVVAKDVDKVVATEAAPAAAVRVEIAVELLGYRSPSSYVSVYVYVYVYVYASLGSAVCAAALGEGVGEVAVSTIRLGWGEGARGVRRWDCEYVSSLMWSNGKGARLTRLCSSKAWSGAVGVVLIPYALHISFAKTMIVDDKQARIAPFPFSLSFFLSLFSFTFTFPFAFLFPFPSL